MRQGLARSIERFAAMQAAHQQALAEGRLAECVLWRGQRELLFRELQQWLEQCRENAGLSDGELAWVRQEIGRLLEGEQRLGEAVRARQERIEEQQSAMRRGRKLLGRFGATAGGAIRGNAPRVVSNRA